MVQDDIFELAYKAMLDTYQIVNKRLHSSHHKTEDSIIEVAQRIADMANLDSDMKTDEDTVDSKLSSIFGLVYGENNNYTKTIPFKEMMEFKGFQENGDHDYYKKIESVYKKLCLEIENQSYKTKYNKLYAFMYRYTYCLPYKVYKNQKSYVSIFDHSKLVSAIASCLYHSDNKEKYYLLEFDISGIQNFIYKVTEGSKTKNEVAKMLRGRSTYIWLLCNLIAYRILKEFHLTQSNIIFNNGGGACLLLPYVDDFESKLSFIKTLTSELFDEFAADITFVYDYIEVDNDELINYKNDKYFQLMKKINKKKAQKFESLLIDNHFAISAEGKCLCSKCESNLCEKEICTTCNKIIQISEKFVRYEQLHILYSFEDYKDSIKLPIGYITFINTYQGQPYDYIESINQCNIGNVKFIANLAPKNEHYNRLLNFEEIANCNKQGDAKLGILKMDVDNLGSIFVFGLMKKDRSLAKYMTLSRYMELFFSKVLSNICLDVSKKYLNQDNNVFYINYAGGDDLVIVGPVDGIVELNNAINLKFKEYVLKPEITLSSGIHIQRPKFPIRFGAKKADSLLDASKELNGKHGVSILDTTSKFSEFITITDRAKEFASDIEHQNISRALAYRLMTNIADKEKQEIMRSIPIMMYSIYRNVKNENDRNKYQSIINNIFKGSENVEHLALSLKLALLLTREEKTNDND